MGGGEGVSFLITVSLLEVDTVVSTGISGEEEAAASAAAAVGEAAAGTFGTYKGAVMIAISKRNL